MSWVRSRSRESADARGIEAERQIVSGEDVETFSGYSNIYLSSFILETHIQQNLENPPHPPQIDRVCGYHVPFSVFIGCRGAV